MLRRYQRRSKRSRRSRRAVNPGHHFDRTRAANETKRCLRLISAKQMRGNPWEEAFQDHGGTKAGRASISQTVARTTAKAGKPHANQMR